MGPSRKTVIQNRDIIKELKVGMLIAIADSDIARVGKPLLIVISQEWEKCWLFHQIFHWIQILPSSGWYRRGHHINPNGKDF